MKSSTLPRLFWQVVPLCFICVSIGCNQGSAQPPAREGESTFLGTPAAVLVLAEKSRTLAEREVVLDFAPTDHENLPRIFDVYLEYDPERAELVGHEPGLAAGEAGKEVMVQDDARRGRVRILIMAGAALNANRIGAGSLAQLRFRKKTNQPTELRLDTSVQVAAPAEAMNQMTFGEPLVL